MTWKVTFQTILLELKKLKSLKRYLVSIYLRNYLTKAREYGWLSGRVLA